MDNSSPPTHAVIGTPCPVEYDFDILVSGHLTRLGDKADVETKIDFFDDILEGARLGLASVSVTDVVVGTGIMDPANPNAGNTW